MPVTARKLPPQIKELVDHLRSTGTGQSKLDKITALGMEARSGEEFIDSVRLNVPPGTWVKVQEYLASIGADVKDPAAGLTSAKEDAGMVSSRSENQSSIPEVTLTHPGRAVTLGEVVAPGVVKARQLGADRVVAGAEEGKVEGDDEGKDEKSELADMNADEAKDAISRMRSKEKLGHIAANDSRSTVKQAAQKRLEELGK